MPIETPIQQKSLPNSFARHRPCAYTYYKEKFARDTKQLIDAMIIDQKNRELLCRQHGLSLDTLEKYITQSYWWLIDHIQGDENAKVYNFWRQNVDIKKKPKSVKCPDAKISIEWVRLLTRAAGMVVPQGEILVIKPYEFSGTDELSKHSEVNLDKTGEWKEKVEEFLVSSEVDVSLEIRDTKFSEQEIEWLKDTAAAMGDVRVEVLNSSNVILRK